MPAVIPRSTPRAVHPWVAEGERRVRFGIYGGPWAARGALLDWAQAVEALGFDSLWVMDHPMLVATDCWTTLAALAVRTDRLRLGSLASCIYHRPPGLLARMAADVDRFSEGRLVLGLGVGDLPWEFRQLGLAEPPLRERAAAMAETVALVRALWRGEAVTAQGTYVHADDARLAALPAQRPHVPLLIAGGGERVTLRQVAEHADMCNFGPHGAAGSAWGVAEVRRKLAALDGHLAAAGRPAGAVLRSHFCSRLIIGRTPEEAGAKLARAVGERSTREAARAPGVARQVSTPTGVPTAEHVEVVYVAGTPEEVAAYFRELVGAGMRYFIVGCLDDAETLRLLGEQVLPQIR